MLDVTFNLILLSAELLLVALVRSASDSGGRAPNIGGHPPSSSTDGAASGWLPILILAVGTLVLGWIAAVQTSQIVQGGGFLLLRCFAWVLFLHLPLVLLVASRNFARRRAAKVAAGSAVALWLVAGWAFAIEPHWLEVSRHRIDVPGLERPLRVAILSDFQTDEIGPFERRVLALLAAQEADLVLLTGDYLQEVDREREQALCPEFREAWAEAKIHAPLGVHAVGGDVEDKVLSFPWPLLFTDLDVVVHAETETVDLGPLTLTALTCEDSRSPHLAVPAVEGPHLVAGHAPDFALTPRGRLHGDVLVAGHTHGGQVRLPIVGPPLTMSQVPRDWAAGRTDLADGRTLIVSRGTGLERGAAPRLRFLCRPELVVLELVPAPAGSTTP